MNERDKKQIVGPDLYPRKLLLRAQEISTSTRNKLPSNMYWPTYTLTYCTGIPLTVRAIQDRAQTVMSWDKEPGGGKAGRGRDKKRYRHAWDRGWGSNTQVMHINISG